MRVATSQFYDYSVSAMGRQHADLLRLQQHITSGRLHTAAENPIGMGKLLRSREAEAQNNQFAANRAAVSDRLQFTELALSNLTNVAQRGKEIALALRKASLSDEERQAYLSEAKGQYEELLSIANRVDGQGVALFGGERATAPYALQAVVPPPVPPSTAPASVVNYLGNGAVPKVDIGNGQMMSTGIAGADAFGPDTPVGDQQSVFRTYEALIAALTPPLTDAASRATLQGQLDDLITHFDNNYQTALNMHVLVGTRQAQLDALDAQGDAHGDQLKAMIADLQAVDTASALSQFALQKTALEAAQQTFVAMRGMSLFNYL